MAEKSYSDLHPTTMALMASSGVDAEEKVVLQGASMRVNVLVWINNTFAPEGRETIEREAVKATLYAEMVEGEKSEDLVQSVKQSVEFSARPDTLVMTENAVESGLLDSGLYLFDSSEIPADFALTDGLLFQDALDEMREKDPDLVGSVLKEQIPRLRFLNNTDLNNYSMPKSRYYVDYVSGESKTPSSWIVYTFEIDTTSLAPGLWDLHVYIDPDQLIAEHFKDNNVIGGNFQIKAPDFDHPALAGGDFVTPSWEIEPCNPWEGESPPTEFLTELYRVYWHRSVGNWEDATGWGFWDSHVEPDSWIERTRRKGMYHTEFWGPVGTGRYNPAGASPVPYYDADHPRPAPSDIRNVFLFFSGQAGVGDKSIATGQRADCDDGLFGTYNEHDTQPVAIHSLAGQIAYQQHTYGELYSPSNTLMAMAFDLQDHLGVAHIHDQITHGWVKYIEASTGMLSNVSVIWMAGISRGGIIAIKIARKLRERINAGLYGNDVDPKIIITALDATSDTLDDLEYVSLCTLYGDDCTGCTANRHDLEKVFPVSADPSQDMTRNLFIRQIVGASREQDSMVHGGYTNYGDDVGGGTGTAYVAGNFYTQRFWKVRHRRFRRDWREPNAINSLRFFFERAWGITNFQPMPEACTCSGVPQVVQRFHNASRPLDEERPKQAQCFEATHDSYLAHVNIQMGYTAGVPVAVKVYQYQSGRAAPDSGTPLGTSIRNNLPGADQGGTQTFHFPSPRPSLTAGQRYWIVVERHPGGTGAISIQRHGYGEGYAEGYTAYYEDGNWRYTSGDLVDWHFGVIGCSSE
jgi:hypothetical protein